MTFSLHKIYLITALLYCLCNSFAQGLTFGIVPLPAKTETVNGKFILGPETRIWITQNDQVSDVQWFNSYLETYYGYSLNITFEKPKDGNYIVLNYPDWEAGWKEKYHLQITEKNIQILAEGGGSGIFYAFQTLVQLLPDQKVTNSKKAPEKYFALPCINIQDQPRFQYRGMHLDVCRHFFGVQFIKRYLDLLAQYKMNVFHWHLTDDQGWRIEIKKYPELTQTGGWRKGSMIGKYSNNKYDTLRYGGYYTQEQIKEIVSYAAKLHITVIPEIEMPGHSVAAISAYPWLSCTGKKIEVAKGWGVFDDVYCTKDSVFNFLENVLSEVCELFPGNYIHIGGDECPKTRWKTCESCQKRKKELGLKDEHELQSYFIQRIEKFLNSKNKQIIGWDEILEGGLAPNATVMSWRGTQGGIDAAKQGHDVIMTPGKPCYFDHYQSKDKSKEPLAIGGYNPVDSIYNYEPIPSTLSEQERIHILGAQGNVWTEYILNEKQVEYMAVPRMCALAEVLWTSKENKSLSSFHQRMKHHRKILDMQNVNYAKHIFK